jgi:hypothetical protein
MHSIFIVLEKREQFGRALKAAPLKLVDALNNTFGIARLRIVNMYYKYDFPPRNARFF